MFDINAMLLAPPDKKCSLHEKQGSRGSWSVRATNVCYVNRTKDYYRWYQVIEEKNQEAKDIRHSGMLPHGCAMPFRSASENASIVLNELVYALKKPAPASTFQNIADKYIAEISDLQKHFKKGNINQVPTKKIQSQPKIQPKENIPEK